MRNVRVWCLAGAWCVLAAWGLPSFGLGWQERPPADAAPAQEADAANSKPTEPRVLTIDDYGLWNRITSVAISPDGRWFTYGYSPNDGDGTLHLRNVATDAVQEIPRGTGPQFSPDSAWVSYTIAPPESERSGSRGRGQRGGDGGSASVFVLHHLDTDEKIEYKNTAGATFSEDGRYLAIRKRSRRCTFHRAA